MQIFLPYPDFHDSAMALDKSRLGNQCWRECKTLYNGGWPNHPAARMLDRYHLSRYALACAIAFNKRKWYTPETRRKWLDFWQAEMNSHQPTPEPDWIGNEDVHSSHRAVLLFKNMEWYGQFGWSEQPLPPDPDTGRFGYVWP